MGRGNVGMVMQDGLMVARVESGCAEAVYRDTMHYAGQYVQDGEVQVVIGTHTIFGGEDPEDAIEDDETVEPVGKAFEIVAIELDEDFYGQA